MGGPLTAYAFCSSRSRFSSLYLSSMPLLTLTDRGLYCAAGDFYVDPWVPVDRAVVTHAHGDHAAWGSRAYLTSEPGLASCGLASTWRADSRGAVRRDAQSERCRVSLHPAGHILGSAQVRVEHRGEVWVVSGDYKTEPDPTCTPFEPVRCHTFVTESTFGLPIYRWSPQARRFAEIAAWWRDNAAAGKASLLFGYALGKAQRLLAGLLHDAVGPILTHGAVERHQSRLPRERRGAPADDLRRARPKGQSYAGALIVAPPSAAGSRGCAGSLPRRPRSPPAGCHARRAPPARARSRLRRSPIMSTGRPCSRPSRRPAPSTCG